MATLNHFIQGKIEVNMIMKYILNRNIEKMSDKEFELACSNEIFEKSTILKYLKSFKPKGYTTAPLIDKKTGEQISEGFAGYSDGEYEWYDYWIYHFEKYNLKLNDDFIAHVLSKIA